MKISFQAQFRFISSHTLPSAGEGAVVITQQGGQALHGVTLLSAHSRGPVFSGLSLVLGSLTIPMVRADYMS